MKVLNPRTHGYLDYVAVIAFLLTPTLFYLTGNATVLSYGLAVTFLLLSILTAYPLGVLKVIPFTVHGGIEFVAAFVLMAAPWIFGFAADAVSRGLYIAIGIVLFAIWMLTDYRAAETHRDIGRHVMHR